MTTQMYSCLPTAVKWWVRWLIIVGDKSENSMGMITLIHLCYFNFLLTWIKARKICIWKNATMPSIASRNGRKGEKCSVKLEDAIDRFLPWTTLSFPGIFIAAFVLHWSNYSHLSLVGRKKEPSALHGHCISGFLQWAQWWTVTPT